MQRLRQAKHAPVLRELQLKLHSNGVLDEHGFSQEGVSDGGRATERATLLQVIGEGDKGYQQHHANERLEATRAKPKRLRRDNNQGIT